MDKTSFKIFIMAILLSIAIFLGLIVISSYIDSDEKELDLEYLESPNMFFTVESCVNKYISLLSAKDSDAIYHLIDDTYKEEHNITINNVLANNITLDNNYTFTAQKILEDKNQRYTYYVLGYLMKNYVDDDEIATRINYSLIVKLDTTNNTYSIIPLDVEEILNEV